MLEKLYALYPWFISTPVWYKGIFGAFIVSGALVVVLGFVLHFKSQSSNDLKIINVKTFIEPQFKERTITFDVENASGENITLSKVQFALFDGSEPIHGFNKTGVANPLFMDEPVGYRLILDNHVGSPAEPRTVFNFNFSKYIEEKKTLIQVYSFTIILTHTNNKTKKISKQEFEYAYVSNGSNHTITPQAKYEG